MKISILFSSILLICFCTQNKSNQVAVFNQTVPKIFTLKSSKEITNKNDTVLLNGGKYSGYLFELHTNNSDTLLIQSYLSGLQSGNDKKWFANKNISEDREYSSGKKNGKQIAFWDNGKKRFEFTANNDAYEGEMKEWNFEGKLIHLANYKNGQEEGTQRLWYENGKIRANYVILNGKRYGLLGTKNCRNVSDSIFIIK